MRLIVKMAAISVCWLLLACAAGQGVDGADTPAPAAGKKGG
jgi:hypothetical protein